MDWTYKINNNNNNNFFLKKEKEEEEEAMDGFWLVFMCCISVFVSMCVMRRPTKRVIIRDGLNLKI
jgi:hypothetical protein